MASFQTILLRNVKGNFNTLLLHKKFYIVLDIIVKHMICICITDENCIISHFYTSCHMKQKCGDFVFFETFLFLFLFFETFLFFS